MAWDREKRGIFQRKQEKPQIKKNRPLKSEGSDGDISIRQLKDGVFLFFKALGKWYKTLNTSSQAIPETPNAMQLGSSAIPVGSMFMSANSLHMGNTKSEQTKISTDGSLLTFKNKAATSYDMLGASAAGNIDFGIGGRNNGITLTSHANANPFKQADGTVLLSFKANAAPYYIQVEQGIIRLAEAGTNPSGADSGFGRLYCKGTDSKPYWMYEDGTELELSSRWQHVVPFYFNQSTTGRTYFRDVHDVDGQNTFSNYDSDIGTSVDDEITVDVPNSISGIPIHAACKLIGTRVMAYQATSANSRIGMQIWTGTPANGGTDVDLTLRMVVNLLANQAQKSVSATDISQTLAAGDMVYPAFKFVATAGEWYGSIALKFEALA